MDITDVLHEIDYLIMAVYFLFMPYTGRTLVKCMN